MNLKIRKFEAADVLRINAREPDLTIVQRVDALKMAREYVMHGPCWTVLLGKQIVFCAGIIIFWNGMGEGWALTSGLVPKFPCSFHRYVKRYLEKTISEYNLHRVQIAIPKTHKISREWALRLGFSKEGVMRKYGPQADDWVRYSLVKT